MAGGGQAYRVRAVLCSGLTRTNSGVGTLAGAGDSLRRNSDWPSSDYRSKCRTDYYGIRSEPHWLSSSCMLCILLW